MWLQNNIEAEIIEIAEEYGHKVIFTPSCFSGPQPIELVWARVKQIIV